MAENDEFIREVDEEYRREQLAQVWTRYSGIFVGLAILLVVSVGGWRYWQYAEEREAQAAATRYEEALRLSREEARAEEARKNLEELAKDATGGYGLLTRFRLAAELGAQSAEEGAKAYDALSADADVKPLWQDLARLRAAMLRMDMAEPVEIRPSLERLATPANPWRHSARELLGLSGLRAGEYDFAARWFNQIAADRETPQGLRQRLEIYTALVAGGPVQATQ
jgi:hypothetical protein